MGQNVLINSQETETEEMSSGKVGGGRKYMADIMGGGDGKESLSLGESNEVRHFFFKGVDYVYYEKRGYGDPGAA